VPPGWEKRGSGGQAAAAAGALAGALASVAAKGGAMSEKERALLAQIQKLEGQLAKEKVKKKVRGHRRHAHRHFLSRTDAHTRQPTCTHTRRHTTLPRSRMAETIMLRIERVDRHNTRT
jgi:hypothetical protein